MAQTRRRRQVGGSHLLDHAKFQAIDGLETVEVLVQKVVEALAGLVIQDEEACEETMAGGILRGALLPLRSGWPARSDAVGA